MLKYTIDNKEFRYKTIAKLKELFSVNPGFQYLIWEFLVYGKIYIVGGFLRDVINQKPSRDIDIIVDLPHNAIEGFLKESALSYKFNRMNGVKIELKDFEVDLWSLDNNWAFKHDLVKKNENNILVGIANGCFYNYDSIVFNVNSMEFHTSNYTNCARNKILDIIQKNVSYKKKNPTVEANILRAFYLQKEFDLRFSENCHAYLVSMINFLNDKYGNPVDRLEEFKHRYEKYEKVYSREELENLIIKTLSDFDTLYHRGRIEGQSKLLF